MNEAILTVLIIITMIFLCSVALWSSFFKNINIVMVAFCFEPSKKNLLCPKHGGLISKLILHRDFEEDDDDSPDWVSELKRRAGWQGVSDG